MIKIFKYNNKCIKFKLNWSIFFKTFTKKHSFLSQYGHRINESWFNRSFGITKKHFTKQDSSPCSLLRKIGIQINNTVYTSKENNLQFPS